MRIVLASEGGLPWDRLKSWPTTSTANACSERTTPIDQKFLAGADLFEYACRLTCDGIRHQNPGIDEAQVQQILRNRLALARRLERRS